MTVSFSEHLDLLDLHGRAAVHSLGRLSPDDGLPPLGDSARGLAEDHWGTLQSWARSLEDPTVHWSQRAQPETPADYSALVAGIGEELGRLGSSLLSAGPQAGIDYFDRPGTVAEVARLLAHEAIAMAHAAGLAAGTTTMALTSAVASDGIDQALGHWGSPEAEGVWQPGTVTVRTTDTDDAWHLSLGREGSNSEDRFRVVAPSVPAAIVEGSANDVLWWLHGYATAEGAVTVDGNRRTIRGVRLVFLRPEEEAPKRRWRLFGR